MDPITEKKVADLAAATAALLSAGPVDRACMAKELIDEAKETFSRVRQDSIAEALAGGRTYEQLAGELGVSSAAINAAITARNARLAVQTVVTPHKGGDLKQIPGSAGRMIGELRRSGTLPAPRLVSEDAGRLEG